MDSELDTALDAKDAEPRRIVIAGGSGFLGTSLADYLTRRGYCTTVLSRTRPQRFGSWKHVYWDSRTSGKWKEELEGADGLVNLTGRSVDCVKTPAHQDEILRSRIESTRALGAAIRQIHSPPPVWVQMGTAHIYGDPPEVHCDEDAPTGYGLAPFVGRAWEEAFLESLLPGQRHVILRTTFVVGRDRGAGGGALSRLRFLSSIGLGGKIGTGKQGVSWIHEADLNRLMERALADTGLSGVYNATSPNPVPNSVFMRELRKACGMPMGLPASAWMVRLGAVFLKTDPELALFGRYVIPRRLQEAGFKFQFPELRNALSDLIRAGSQ